MSVNFSAVTELSGDEVTQEQVDRCCNRYYWAGTYCTDKDVLEVACGTGQGLGYLTKVARSVHAGDYSDDILTVAKAHYGNRIVLKQFDAQDMPYADRSMDVIVLFEAIYYIPSAEKFVSECRRILRENGKVLVVTANKDLYDFNPSPHSYKYYGVVELSELFGKQGFSVEFFGNTPVDKLSLRQKLLRPVKKVVVKLGCVPKTMAGKKVFKKIIFGNLVSMPAEITENTGPYIQPTKISSIQPDKKHKVLYCVATLQKSN
ncbi:MAG: class I SAM-dependent methyltransferase [Candidatus Manganitrophus sp. SA1]|nr:class I SAM-dependent methyltransferase [Candidatus Manganitrophus morganii]